MSRTLIPVSGPSPLADAIEARHLRRIGQDVRVGCLLVLSKNDVRVLNDADMVMIRMVSRTKYV
jgi:hypothetical protein